MKSFHSLIRSLSLSLFLCPLASSCMDKDTTSIKDMSIDTTNYTPATFERELAKLKELANDEGTLNDAKGYFYQLVRKWHPNRELNAVYNATKRFTRLLYIYDFLNMEDIYS